MTRFLMVVILACAVQACSKPVPDLKSPCVGAEGSPCGERYPLNEQWLKDLHKKA